MKINEISIKDRFLESFSSIFNLNWSIFGENFVLIEDCVLYSIESCTEFSTIELVSEADRSSAAKSHRTYAFLASGFSC